jgi:hypothetical protein
MGTETTEIKPTTNEGGLVDLVVIRQILEREIQSYYRSVERSAKTEAYNAAASDDLIRRGISHALFVLSQECGV